MALKKKEDEGGGANWMDTYADLVTLLFAFFVLLFAMSSVEDQKWAAFVGAFSGNNAIVITPYTPEMAMEKPIQDIAVPIQTAASAGESATTEPVTEPPDEQGKELKELYELYGLFKDYLSQSGLGFSIGVDEENMVLIIRLEDSIFFESGKADILKESYGILDKMLEILTANIGRIGMVEVEGHTDSRPIYTSQFRDNWALSSTRAMNVVRYFREIGSIPGEMLKGTGRGEYEPLESNGTEEGMQKNRRVEFRISSVQY